MSTIETSFGKIEIAEFVPTVENADVLPLIDALKSADGDDIGKNVAYTSYPTEEEAKKYRTKIQRVARVVGERTAWSTIAEDKAEGKWVLTTRLRPQIKREVKETEPEVETAAKVASK